MSTDDANSNSSLWIIRLPYVIALVVFCLLFGSFFLQYGLDEQPCALCLIQRYCLIILLFWWGISHYFPMLRTWLSLRYFIGMVVSVVLLNLASLQYLEQQSPMEEMGFCAAGQEILDSSLLSSLMPADVSSCSEAAPFSSEWSLLLWLVGFYMTLVVFHVFGFYYHRYIKES